MGGVNLLVLECSNCFSRKLIKHLTAESYQCRGCGILMNINQVIISKIEDSMELSNNYWVSRDGMSHEFKDMSADHLKNCIELLKRSYSAKELKNSNLFIGLTQEYMLR